MFPKLFTHEKTQYKITKCLAENSKNVQLHFLEKEELVADWDGKTVAYARS